MAFKVEVLADSVALNGQRLVTMELTYPRFVHAEFMTHRMFSRNAASSRAIPINKMIERVESDPVVPVHWGRNQKGMQADEELSPGEQKVVERMWLMARDEVLDNVRALYGLGVHKQIVNRLLEPWSWITVICSGTEWDNFFNLRCHKDAQPEIRKLAEMMLAAYVQSEPVVLDYGQWHRPLIYPQDIEDVTTAAGGFASDYESALNMISVGRCARVSYLTHDGVRSFEADIELCTRLAKAGHCSPFEHVATPSDEPLTWANFKGWMQYRRTIPRENKIGFDYEGRADEVMLKA